MKEMSVECWLNDTDKKRKHSEENCPVATLLTTNLT
jgi:hypothetical protein